MNLLPGGAGSVSTATLSISSRDCGGEGESSTSGALDVEGALRGVFETMIFSFEVDGLEGVALASGCTAARRERVDWLELAVPER